MKLPRYTSTALPSTAAISPSQAAAGAAAPMKVVAAVGGAVDEWETKMRRVEDAAEVNDAQEEANKRRGALEAEEESYGAEVDGIPVADKIRENRAELAQELRTSGLDKVRDKETREKLRHQMALMADDVVNAGEKNINKRRMDSARNSYYKSHDKGLEILGQATDDEERKARRAALLDGLDIFSDVLSPEQKRSAKLQIDAAADNAQAGYLADDYQQMLLSGDANGAEEHFKKVRDNTKLDADVKDAAIKAMTSIHDREKTMQRSDADYARKLEKQQRDDNYNAADLIIDETGGDLTKIPTDVWEDLTPKQRDDLNASSKRIRTGEDTITDEVMLDEIQDMPWQELGEMSSADFRSVYRAGLSNSDWTKMKALQVSAQEKVRTGVDPDGLIGTKERINTAIYESELGIPAKKQSASEAKRNNSIRRDISDLIESEARAKGVKSLGHDRENEIIANELRSYRIAQFGPDRQEAGVNMTFKDKGKAYIAIDDWASETNRAKDPKVVGVMNILRGYDPAVADLSNEQILGDYEYTIERVWGVMQATKGMDESVRERMVDEAIRNSLDGK